MAGKHSYRSTLGAYLPRLRPTFLSFFGYGILQVVNLFVISHLENPDAITIAALGYKIGFLPTYFLSGLTNAMAIMAAQAVVNDDYRLSTKSFGVTFWMSTCLSLVFSLLFFFFPQVTYWMSQGDKVAGETVRYIRIVSFSLVPWAMCMCIRKYLRGIDWMRSASFINLSTSVISIVTCYGLVHGRFSFPKKDLYGIPFSLVLSRWYGLSVALLVLYRVYQRGLIRWEDLWSLDGRTAKWVLIGGVPLGMELLLGHVYNGLVEQILTGKVGLEANRLATFVSSTQQLFRTCAAAIPVVAGILMGKAWKRGDRKEQHMIKEVGHLLCMVVTFISVGIMCVFFEDLGALSSTGIRGDARAMHEAKRILAWSLIPFVLYCIKTLNIALLSGLGDGPAVGVITFLAYFGVGYPLCSLLAFTFGWGLKGVFVGNALTYLLITLLCSYRFYSKWRRR